MPYLDTTFCASPNCKNKCERKMTAQQEIDSIKYCDFMTIDGRAFDGVSWAYFCDESVEVIDDQ